MERGLPLEEIIGWGNTLLRFSRLRKGAYWMRRSLLLAHSPLITQVIVAWRLLVQNARWRFIWIGLSISSAWTRCTKR